MSKEYHYTQRAMTPEWEENYDKLYGKRCIKHPRIRLIDGRCKECDWGNYESKKEEYSQ